MEHRVDDSRSLRTELLATVARAVPFDHHAFLLTDPVTCVGVDPLAAVAWLADLPRHVRLKYATSVNRWTGLGPPYVASLDEATSGDRSQSPLWRDLLGPRGVGDVASLVFRDSYGCWGFLELFRDAGRPPFSATELTFLAGTVGPVTSALRRSQAATFVVAAPARPAPGAAVLILSDDLEVVGRTADSEDLLRLLVPPEQSRPVVPASAYNVAAQLLAAEAGVDSHEPSARVHLGGGRWLTLRASRLAGDPTRPGTIAVSIEACSPAERLDLFTRAYTLSAREGDVLAGLARGADTRDLARTLYLSEHTVQDHLKSIFAKTGSRNRRMVLARALGG